METELTDNMKWALIFVGFGVRKYEDGYYSEDDPTNRVDGRSLEALRKRGMITWSTAGGAPQMIHLHLTEAGQQQFDILWESGKFRKEW